jgi:C1A family cysteine protease
MVLKSFCVALVALTLAAAATPNGKTYCCGVGSGDDCGSPDWSMVIFQFNEGATKVNITANIDGTVNNCEAEGATVVGTKVTFPAQTSKGDCLGKLVVSSGAPVTDLVVTYDPTKDTLDVDVDSEGLSITMGTCKSYEEDDATTSFRTFLTTYNKDYKNATEFDYRLSVFMKNLEIVKARNGEGEAEHGITKFSDLTSEEFRSFYLGYVAPSAARDELDLPLTNSSNAASVDWRGKSPAVLTPIKNQAQCGSCWAFSATEQIETDFAMAGNKIISLGVQQIVSCDKTDDGCNGGNTETAYEYVQKAGGLETEANYPYTSGKGKTGRCKVEKAMEVVSIKGYNTVSKTEASEMKMVTQIASSPISVCVDATKWQTYKKGIIGRTCGKQLDHCVQAVGLNTDGAKSYWIVRNSWASDWGEDGYIYVEEGINACGIAKDATTVNI